MNRFCKSSGTNDKKTFEILMIWGVSFDSVRMGAFSDRVIVRMIMIILDTTIPLINPNPIPPNRLSHPRKMAWTNL